MPQETPLVAYNNLVFDLDGTLSDPRQGIFKGIHYALNKMDIETCGSEDFSHFIGAPLQDSFSKHYFEDTNKALMAVKLFRDYYGEKGLFENVLYEGISELISGLSEKYMLFVLTNKPKVFADRILNHFELFDYFDAIAGVDKGGKTISKSDLIPGLIAGQPSFSNDQTLMIGDTSYDIDCAKQNNWDVFAVTYGFGEKTELASLSPTRLVHSVEELKTILL